MTLVSERNSMIPKEERIAWLIKSNNSAQLAECVVELEDEIDTLKRELFEAKTERRCLDSLLIELRQILGAIIRSNK